MYKGVTPVIPEVHRVSEASKIGTIRLEEKELELFQLWTHPSGRSFRWHSYLYPDVGEFWSLVRILRVTMKYSQFGISQLANGSGIQIGIISISKTTTILLPMMSSLDANREHWSMSSSLNSANVLTTGHHPLCVSSVIAE